MNEYSTILVPSNSTAPIHYVDVNLDERSPIHVAQVCKENPDEFGLAFYSGHHGEKIGTSELSVNDRATMIALAVSTRPSGDIPDLNGDIVVRCDKELADLIVENDNRFITDGKVVRAFRTWMKEFATANDLEVEAVFHTVAGYAGHVLAEAEARQEADMQKAIADMMGLTPEQVGVIRL